MNQKIRSISIFALVVFAFSFVSVVSAEDLVGYKRQALVNNEDVTPEDLQAMLQNMEDDIRGPFNTAIRQYMQAGARSDAELANRTQKNNDLAQSALNTNGQTLQLVQQLTSRLNSFETNTNSRLATVEANQKTFRAEIDALKAEMAKNKKAQVVSANIARRISVTTPNTASVMLSAGVHQNREFKFAIPYNSGSSTFDKNYMLGTLDRIRQGGYTVKEIWGTASGNSDADKKLAKDRLNNGIEQAEKYIPANLDSGYATKEILDFRTKGGMFTVFICEGKPEDTYTFAEQLSENVEVLKQQIETASTVELNSATKAVEQAIKAVSDAGIKLQTAQKAKTNADAEFTRVSQAVAAGTMSTTDTKYTDAVANLGTAATKLAAKETNIETARKALQQARQSEQDVRKKIADLKQEYTVAVSKVSPTKKFAQAR